MRKKVASPLDLAGERANSRDVTQVNFSLDRARWDHRFREERPVGNIKIGTINNGDNKNENKNNFMAPTCFIFAKSRRRKFLSAYMSRVNLTSRYFYVPHRIRVTYRIFLWTVRARVCFCFCFLVPFCFFYYWSFVIRIWNVQQCRRGKRLTRGLRWPISLGVWNLRSANRSGLKNAHVRDVSPHLGPMARPARNSEILFFERLSKFSESISGSFGHWYVVP